jgi:stage III sporulation protein SpoIIIAA
LKQQKITDDLEALVAVLPPHIQKALREADRADELLEVVLDLGRLPEARFLHHEVKLADSEVTREDIQHVVDLIGDFGDDNRAGIERTLHRI